MANDFSLIGFLLPFVFAFRSNRKTRAQATCNIQLFTGYHQGEWDVLSFSCQASADLFVFSASVWALMKNKPHFKHLGSGPGITIKGELEPRQTVYLSGLYQLTWKQVTPSPRYQSSLKSRPCQAFQRLHRATEVQLEQERPCMSQCYFPSPMVTALSLAFFIFYGEFEEMSQLYSRNSVLSICLPVSVCRSPFSRSL